MAEDRRLIDAAVEKVRDLYSGNIARHGSSPLSVGWRDEVSQRMRFEKLAYVIGSDGQEGISINDLGCGYGAMYDYLSSHPNYSVQKYHGYDISAEMLQVAEHRCEVGVCEFHLDSKLRTRADYSFVSGTFNVRMNASEEEWGAFILENLRMMAENSTRGFAFNLLSTYVDWKESHLHYGDPLRFFDFCKREFSAPVALLHDYPLYEWTICVRL
jgi:SAM-dependent methyltransferase